MLSSILLRGFGPLAIATVLVIIVKRQSWFVKTKGIPSTKRVLTTFALGFIITSGAVVLWLHPMYHKIVALERHGHRAVAEVVNIYVASSRSGPSHNVVYRYPNPKSARGLPYIMGDEHLLEGDREITEATGKVPIAYSIDDPTISMLNFRDEALRDRTGKFYSTVIPLGFMLSIAGGVMIMMMCTNISLRQPEAFGRGEGRLASNRRRPISG